MTIHILEQVKEDIEFLLSFTPTSDPSKVVPDLAPMFYFSGTYEGDQELAKKVEGIRGRYNIVEQDDEEEDFEEATG